MVKSKAIKVLKQLNKEEFHRLEKFLQSPYFNTNKNLVKFYKFLKKFHPEFASPKFTKENVFKTLYENEGYNDGKIRKLFSDLYKELEKFLVMLQLENHKTIYDRLLLEMLDSKKLDSIFLSKFTEANRFLDDREFEYSYYLEKYLLQWHYILFHLDRGMQEKIVQNVFERGNYSTLFFLSDLFFTLNDITANRFSFEIIIDENMSEKFLDYFDIESFFRHLDENKILHKEMIKIYYFAYLANKNFDEESHYYRLEKYVYENYKKFSRIGQINAFTYLINYCTRKTAIGKESFMINLNKLYRTFLNNKLLMREQEGFVRSDIFLLILDNFFLTGKIDELGPYLQRNINQLNPKHRANILCYFHSLVNFNKKEYDNALKSITQVKTSSFLFNNRIKPLILKIYYELGLFEELKGYLSNYKRFLAADKSISELTKSRLSRFIYIYNELLKINVKGIDVFKIDKLKKEIDADHDFYGKPWIKEKIKDLDKKIRLNSNSL